MLSAGADTDLTDEIRSGLTLEMNAITATAWAGQQDMMAALIDSGVRYSSQRFERGCFSQSIRVHLDDTPEDGNRGLSIATRLEGAIAA